MAPWSGLWGGRPVGEAYRGTPVVVMMANPKWFISDISSPEDEEEDLLARRKGSRTKNAKQIRWVLLIKAHRAAGCLASLASAAVALGAAARRRMAAGRTDTEADAGESPVVRSRFYAFIKAFLIVSVLLLAVELAAHFNGWNLAASALALPVIGLESLYASWLRFRAIYVAPSLQFLTNACVVLFLIQSADRIIQCLGCFYIQLRRLKPELKSPALPDAEDPDAGYYPMVLVQIPMCNEKEVYQQSIAAVCNLDWPKSNFLVQVLDDSDDPLTQTLIREEVAKWQQQGARIVYRHRVLRDGYKAGNLKSAMGCSYVKDYEFVTIFDADFQPNPDFLKRTVPHFKDNDELGLVQARWSFVNKDENLLTRLQNINLCFHFEVEQQCQCELPESYEAYRKQQHRWHSGPMQLFRLCLPDIIKCKIAFWKKANLIFLFFLLRKLILPFYSFTLFCIILPMTMFVPEAELPEWVVCYIPALMSLLNILPSPKSFPFIIPYLLFENTMSVTKFNAMISGLFQLGSAYEWVVTKKSGRSSEGDLISLAPKELKHQKNVSAPNLDAVTKEQSALKKDSKKKHNRIYKKELALSMLLLTAAARSLLSKQGIHFYFLLFQGISFLLVGLDLIGEQIE
ncbi:hypothetical protein PR202_gb10799 [Eleusine coracana subsp. coracana]|uniref:Glycosyltransferase 2-like domain-containing protein n=1 Tax=Eleusine coracana subsp. coracana TaxID=191504 RepID=A0AAV5EII8_ELECO|nr:hypothetical protein PR202_gb10799 [Eleusine coracana subsp. coracana]